MSNFSALKTAIQNAIKQNGNEEITGDVLQQILLSIVSTMGDGAINTIEQNLSQETTDRQEADTQLHNAINAINTYLAKGYIFAGVATPTGTPVSGKVFYVATTAGTYTYFGNLQVQNGISILLVENGSWTLHQLLVVDFSLVQNSNNPVRGGAIYQAIQHEETERQAADTRLQKNINNEKSRAVGVENGLHQEIAAETDKRKQEIQGMRDDVLDLIHEYRPIEIEGNVVNAPDEEDITQQPNNLLKFKDKDYNPTIFSGLGRKYLRKNIIINEDYTSFDGFEMNPEADAMLEGQPDSIFWDRLRERFIAEKDGVYYLDWQGSGDYIPVSADKIYVNENIPYFWNGEDLAVDDDVIARYGNILTQEMMSDANTIYVIQYDYTLGENITVPANCVLEFDGGSISGEHTLTGANTGIQAGLVKILGTDATLAGTWNVSEAYPEWFGAKGDGSIDNTKTIQSCINLVESNNGGIVYINKGIYLISDTLYIHKSNIKIVGAGKFDTILKPSPSMIGDYDPEDGTFNVKFVISAENQNQKITKQITLPIERGAERIAINSGEGLERNMLVYIKSNVLWTSENRNSAKKGETNIVRSFDNNYCYFDTYIEFDYAAGETVDVQFVKPLEGVEIRNIGISPDVDCSLYERHYRGFLVEGCYGAVIDSCYGFGCGSSCFESFNSYKTYITNNVVRQAYSYVGDNIYGMGYALRCTNDKLSVIKNNIVDEARHGFDLSGSYPAIGIEVSGNTINSTVSNYGAGSTHGPAYNCTIKNNVISGPCSLNIRGEGISIENNYLIGNIINYYGRNNRYIGNNIKGYISFGKPDTDDKTNFTIIKDNEFWQNHIFELLKVDNVAYDNAKNFIIENNLVHSSRSIAYCVNISYAGGNVTFGQGFVFKNNFAIVNHPSEASFQQLRFVNNDSDYNLITFGNNKWEFIASDAYVAQNVLGKNVIGANALIKSIGMPTWYNGEKWISADGVKAGTPVTGKFSQKPTVAADIFQGFMFMINDADLGLHFPIFAQISGNNINWYKADGTLYTGE